MILADRPKVEGYRPQNRLEEACLCDYGALCVALDAYRPICSGPPRQLHFLALPLRSTADREKKRRPAIAARRLASNDMKTPVDQNAFVNCAPKMRMLPS